MISTPVGAEEKSAGRRREAGGRRRKSAGAEDCQNNFKQFQKNSHLIMKFNPFFSFWFSPFGFLD
jgi:hypothetical protein